MYKEDRTFLAIPGPVEIHPKVYEAMNRHTYGHRTSHFKEIYKDCMEKFQTTINTKRDIQIHAGSGSFGLHTAISNLVKSSDHVLNIVNGKFGERMEKISARFTTNSHVLRTEYGFGTSPEMVKEALESNPDTSIVTITHNETSTGVLNPLEEISEVVHDHGALLVADCITSAGGDKVEMDKWKIDFFISGSQKCYGLPPGLAFISFSSSAEEKMQSVTRNQDYYGDLLQFAKAEIGVTPFTPAVNLIYGLQASLGLILEEGMTNRIARHKKMGSLYRDAMNNLGLDLFAESGYRSNTVTTTKVPVNTNPTIISQTALDYGIMIAGGQGSLKGNIFRVGHMNLVGPREMLMIVSVIEIALKNAGADISLGDGIRMVQEGLLSQ